MNEKIFTGIDIGTEKIKVFSVLSHSDKFSKASTPSEGILHGYIQNKEKASHSLQKSLITAENKIKKPISQALFGINSLGINSRILQTSRILSRNQSEITKRVLDEMERNIAGKDVKHPFSSLLLIPIEYELDGYKSYMSPVGSIASKISIKYLQVFCPANHIKMIENISDLSDIEILDIYPSSLSSSMNICKNTEKNAGVLFIDFGHSITSFTVLKNGQPYKTKTIPFGSDKLSESIALKLKITKKEAEDIKKRPPLDNKKREIIGRVISAYIRDMHKEMHSDLEKIDPDGIYFTSGIVLSGSGSRLKDIEHIFSKFFKMPVRKITDPNLETIESSFTSAYSLALLNKKNFLSHDPSLRPSVGGIFKKVPLIKKWLR